MTEVVMNAQSSNKDSESKIGMQGVPRTIDVPSAALARGLSILTALAVSLTASSAWAQAGERTLDQPPVVKSQTGSKTQPGAGARMGESFEREQRYSLKMAHVRSTIWNPNTQKTDNVLLRAYQCDGAQGCQNTPKASFVAPTIYAHPGQTVRIGLNNQMNMGTCTDPPPGDINKPNCRNFDKTNLHAHGLWVSPQGNSDNVLLTINPGVKFEYEYNIPNDHPAGTFWYHPHVHGSTAIQVGSGMAGALIIPGSRVPTPKDPGDIDTLLYNFDNTRIDEAVILLQQIAYACRDQGKIKKDPKDSSWTCDSNDVGTVESYDQFQQTSPTATAWKESGRYTSINGLVQPTGVNYTGKIYRWRYINAGIRDTIKLQIRRSDSGSKSNIQPNQLPGCDGAIVPQVEIATDGLTRKKAIEKNENVLQPAYRSDVLIAFPQSGLYCLIDQSSPASASINNQADKPQILGWIRVIGQGQWVPGLGKGSLIVSALQRAAGRMPLDVRQKVLNDLNNGVQLTSFVPHLDIAPSEVKGKQEVIFNIDFSDLNNMKFQIGGAGGNGGQSGKPAAYDPTRADRILPLDSVEEWTLTSKLSGHPFHIHVNPFQVVSITNKQGVDVSVTGEPDDPQYAGLQGAWKDTIFVKEGYTITTRTRYERYIGDFVLHCHILDHEDHGMMQNVSIRIPDGKSGTVAPGHQH
jgi:FtsP/CotA-like multicopper oxidase with cupredoxin domain